MSGSLTPRAKDSYPGWVKPTRSPLPLVKAVGHPTHSPLAPVGVLGYNLKPA